MKKLQARIIIKHEYMVFDDEVGETIHTHYVSNGDEYLQILAKYYSQFSESELDIEVHHPYVGKIVGTGQKIYETLVDLLNGGTYQITRVPDTDFNWSPGYC